MENLHVRRFGPFELDVRAGELRKHGIRIRLPEQAFQILLMLIEQPGEVITRADIRLRLWPNDTVVDFDQSINAAVKRLRTALGETAETPRFIETLAKRGYRFVGKPEVAGEERELPDGRSPHYRLLEKLGEGGMGVVYRAEDLKLGRQVAVKFLPAGGESTRAALERFEREAKAASALNHPNICTIHGLEDFAGKPGMVMELVDGETLAARVARGRLPLPEALAIALQVCSALGEAHGAGVVHRDLKPSNIMLTKNGVKVLDFGLATMEKTASAAAHAEAATEACAIPGTLYYMSPEQVRGEQVDARSDIFCLGLVLYEMLNGRRPFEAQSAASLRTAVLQGEPAVTIGVPERVAQFLARCLAKDASARWQSALEARAELERISRGDVEAATPHGLRWSWRWVAAGIALALALAGTRLIGIYSGRDRGSELPPTRVVPLTTYPGLTTFVAFSPDGEKIAYSWVGPPGKISRQLHIYVKPVGNGESVAVTSGPGDDRLPQWSPDGSQIAFERSGPEGRELMVAPVGGGAERKLAKVGVGAAWSPDGKEIAYVAPYAPEGSGGIVVQNLKTGQIRELTHPKPYAEGLVAWSPDGTQIAFTRSLSDAARELFVVPSGGGESRRLTFDKQITEGFTWTRDSKELVFVSYRGGGPNLWRIPAKGGTPERVASMAHHPSFPAISPRGNRLAFTEAFGDSNIWEYQRVGGSAKFQPAKCLICSTVEDHSPRFSPDGRKIVFVSMRTGSTELWVADSDGSYPMQLTSIGGAPTGSPRWSPDGHWIAFDSVMAGSSDIYVISAQGGAPRRVTTDPTAEIEPSWSHDGRWIYFTSDRGHGSQLWKVSFEGGAVQQVTSGNAAEAMESADGKRLYYFRGRQDGLWSMPVGGGAEEVIPQLRNVIPTRAWTVRAEGIYFYQDAAPDGHLIQFFNFGTGKVTTLIHAEKAPLRTAPGLEVSPDGQRIVYTQVDQKAEGLMMIENFR